MTPNNPLALIEARLDNIETILLELHYNTGGRPLQNPGKQTGKVMASGKKPHQQQIPKKPSKNSFE
jgi:hypothetical protein